MNNLDLEKWQVEVIWNAIAQPLRYFMRLKQRMEATGFPKNDPLYEDVKRVYDDLNRLNNDLFELMNNDENGRMKKRRR